MNRRMAFPAAALVLLGGLASGQAGRPVASSGAQIKFHFENPKLQPASYTFVVNEDGSGHFQSHPGEGAAPDAEGIEPQPVSRDIKIGQPLLGQIFQTARAQKFFAETCDGKKDKIAFTGRKTVSYTGPDGHGACTFNWSKDQQINHLTDEFIAVANTLEEGRKLAVEHEHSRLSLDAELESLEDAVKNGQAMEIENIAPELTSISSDEAVMDRARARARRLLASAKEHS